MKPYYDDGTVVILHGDCRAILPTLAAGSVQTCVTSPPYFGLRSYIDDPNQLGLEPTPAAYVAELTGVFEQVRRVVTDTLWLNLGDSYNNNASNQQNSAGFDRPSRDGAFHQLGRKNRIACDWGLKQKDLIGIPWRVAFALQDAGWWLRSDIIWAKGNPMPESVTDRPTKAHEYLFLLAKVERYYYAAAAIAEPVIKGAAGSSFTNGKTGVNGLGRMSEAERIEGNTRNKRTVWTVSSSGFPGAHFAVFPEKLIEPCILAGCAAGGVVLDPFSGSGTTGVVAKKLGRKAILIDQNISYCEMAADRIEATPTPFPFEVFA